MLCAVLGLLIFAVLWWGNLPSRKRLREVPGATINKQPALFASRTFDPATPPAGMPPLSGGEDAECESNFLSNASVGGQTRQTDATHATLTITKIKMTLQLNVTVWVPVGVTEHVIEHEEGHRQISEYYYQTADKLAERIAAKYMGKQIDIGVDLSGTDLDAESSKVLGQMATEVTDEYNKQLNPEPTQLLYDTITDHSRNQVVAKDAVAHALKNVTIESTQPASPDQ
jgi:hypothetical protein